jgi:hypothetical protein
MNQPQLNPKPKHMKKIITLIAAVLITQMSTGQAVMLCDFDGVKKVSFKDYDGTLDSNATNSMTSAVNMSAKCGMYIRKATQFDNLKLYAHTKFADVSPFAQATTVNKISMKVMSNMPVGSKIDVQLGTRTDQNYPGGVHSIYTGTTTMMHQWENITFNLSTVLLSSGGFQYPGSIDKFVILFNTNAMSTDSIWFDDIMGPDVEAPTAIKENKGGTFKIFQNQPNPAKEITTVSFELGTSANVTLYVYDMLGKPVCNTISGQFSAGRHDINLDTQSLSDGVYFYTVKKGDVSQTMKMVVSK